jgi:hypothetical protein
VTRPEPEEAQRIADRDLSAAIAEALRAYGITEEGEIPVDWVVVGVAESPDPPDGTRMFTLMDGGSVPTYRIVGLLRSHLVLIEAYLAHGPDEE